MIDQYYWPTPNGHKVTIFLEEAGLVRDARKMTPAMAAGASDRLWSVAELIERAIGDADEHLRRDSEGECAMDSGMNRSALKIDWPRVLFEGLISGMLMGGLVGLFVTGGSENGRMLSAISVASSLLLIWRLLAQQLDRIESKLSN